MGNILNYSSLSGNPGFYLPWVPLLKVCHCKGITQDELQSNNKNTNIRGEKQTLHI